MAKFDYTFGNRFQRQVRLAIVELLLYRYGESIEDFHPKKLSEEQKFDLVVEALAHKKWDNYRGPEYALKETFQIILEAHKEFSWDKVYDNAYYGDFK